MPKYEFETHWRFEAPIDRVWDAIYQSDRWPTWWRDVLRVDTLEPGDQEGIGAVRRYHWKTALPYSFVFETRTTQAARPTLLEAHAFGDLVGTGRWVLLTEDGLTSVRYDWHVRTSKGWMNLLAPLLRPAFAWNHDTVMRHGGQDLAHHLGARFVSAT